MNLYNLKSLNQSIIALCSQPTRNLTKKNQKQVKFQNTQDPVRSAFCRTTSISNSKNVMLCCDLYSKKLTFLFFKYGHQFRVLGEIFCFEKEVNRKCLYSDSNLNMNPKFIFEISSQVLKIFCGKKTPLSSFGNQIFETISRSEGKQKNKESENYTSFNVKYSDSNDKSA